MSETFAGWPDMTPEQKTIWNSTLAWLDAGGDKQFDFNMMDWFTVRSCGTSCCIGGYIDALTLEAGDTIDARPVEEIAKAAGITNAAACRLFFRWGHTGTDTKAAAQRVRNMLRLGEIQWLRSPKEMEA